MVKQRILLISLVSFLIFGLLLGGKIIYQKKWQDVSVLRQSQQITGVVSAKVISNNGLKELDVVTNKLTNLRQASLALQKLSDNYPIRFLDQKNDALEKVFAQMQFALQEGIALGNFTEMEQKSITINHHAVELRFMVLWEALLILPIQCFVNDASREIGR